MLQIAIVELLKPTASKPYPHSDFYYLDVNDLSLSLNFELADMTEVGRSKAPHTLTFDLPFTDTNDKRLMRFREIGSTGNANTTEDVVVFHNGERVLAGVLQVTSADLQARKYKCVIYGATIDIYGKLRSASWVDVFTNPDGTISQALNHRKTAENVRRSNHGSDVAPALYDITDGEVGEDVVWYPIQDTYQDVPEGASYSPYVLTQGFVTNSQTGSRRWTARSHVPALQVSYLLQVVMQYAGYELNMTAGAMATSGDTPRFDKMYYLTDPENQTYRPYYGAQVVGSQLLSIQGQVTDTGTGTSTNVIYSIYGSSTTTSTSIYENWFNIEAYTATTPTYDPDNLFTQLGFEAPNTGTYVFTIRWRYTKGTTPDLHKTGVSALNFSEGIETPIQWVSISSGQSSGTSEYNNEVTTIVTASVGQYILFKFHWEGVAAANPIVIESNDFAVTLNSYIADTDYLAVPQSIGQEKVGEWFEALMTRFNLALDVNFYTKEVSLLERAKLFNDDPSSAKDWSTKVDRSKPFVVRGNGDNLHRQITFQSAEGEEYATQWWNETYGAFDRAIFRSTLPYAKGDETIGEYFACPRFRRLPDSVNTYNHFYADGINQSEKPIFLYAHQQESSYDASPRGHVPTLLYRGEQQESYYLGVQDNLILYDNANDQTLLAQASIKYTSIPQAWYGNRTLYFNQMGSMDGVDHATRQGLRVAAYGRELRDKYNTEQRVVECEVRLDVADVSNLSYSDVIRIDTQLYYIDAIREYYVGQRRNCKAQLRKFVYAGNVEQALGTCTLDVQNIEVSCDGLVTFIDSQGLSLAGNYGCCFYYGGGTWTWDEDTGRCNTGAQCDSALFRGMKNQGGMVSKDTLGYMNFGAGQVVYGVDDSDNTQIITFQLETSSVTGGTYSYGKSSDNIDHFLLPPNVNVGFNVEYIATDTTDANKGDVEFGTWTGVIRSIDFVTSKAGADDVTSRIGDTSPLSFGVEAAVVDDKNYVRFYCGGITGDWTIQVTAEVRVIDQTQTSAVKAMAMQDESYILIQDDYLLLG